MIDLKTEYTDIKDVKHNVEHLTIAADDPNSSERVVAELFNALGRPSQRTRASKALQK